jgi:tetratricopeptide (TPR) repeat protein
MRVVALVLVVVGLATGTRSLARAQPAPLSPEAQRHLDAGLALYAAEDFAGASREFDAAYQLDPAPALLYAWAQAKRYGGRCDEAIALYRRYLEAKLNESQIAAARDGIATCTAELRASPPPPSTPTTVLAPDPAVDRPPRRPWYRNRLGAVLATAGVATAGIGVGFLVAAERSEDRAHRATFRDDFGRLLDEATTRRRIGGVALGVGAALAAGGVISFVVARDPDRRGTAGITTDGTSVLVWGAF